MDLAGDQLREKERERKPNPAKIWSLIFGSVDSHVCGINTDKKETRCVAYGKMKQGDYKSSSLCFLMDYDQ